MKITASEVDIIGSLENNGVSAADTVITDKTLNVATTTDIAEIALPDGDNVSISIITFWQQNDGTTYRTAGCIHTVLTAVSDYAGNITVQNYSGEDAVAGTDSGNSYVDHDFIADEANNKVVIQTTHAHGVTYTPTEVKATISIKNPSGKTITVL